MVILSIRWLTVPLLFAVGWLASRRRPEASRAVARLFAAIALLLLMSLAATGGAASSEASLYVHRWTAHGLVIFLWLTIPYALGVVLQRKLRSTPIRAILQSLLMLLCFGMGLVASFTGYLDPLRSPDVGEETANRFFVQHQVVLPTILGTLLLAWTYAFRPPRDKAKSAP
jgi:hypothetical protein